MQIRLNPYVPRVTRFGEDKPAPPPVPPTPPPPPPVPPETVSLEDIWTGS